MKLHRPFWTELQARYGNLFYVRDEGEQSSVLNSVEALTTCLAKPEGCTVVPGIPQDQVRGGGRGTVGIGESPVDQVRGRAAEFVGGVVEQLS